jgi:hypothetical protein
MLTLAEKIAVMQAALAGKEIEWGYGPAPKVWYPFPQGDASQAFWNWENYSYRVRPREPK